MEGLKLEDFGKWLLAADRFDLIEVAEMVRKAQERKADEGRVTLIRVAADGINVGHFRNDNVEGALRYLLANAADIHDDARLERVRLPASEVDAHLAARWWTTKEKPND